MDEAIETLKSLVKTARYIGNDQQLPISLDLLEELFRRLDGPKPSLRSASSHDLLTELMDRETRRGLYPATMTTVQGD